MIDGLFIHALVEELNQSLAKARIEKVVQTDDHSFVLLCYHQREKKQLMIDLSPEHFRMHLTQKNVGESKSSQFVMTLKKQIEGAIIDRITQYQTDRVVIIDLTVYDFIDGPIQKQIIFEAMGKHSNLMLIKDGVIIDTFKKMFFERVVNFFHKQHSNIFHPIRNLQRTSSIIISKNPMILSISTWVYHRCLPSIFLKNGFSGTT